MYAIHIGVYYAIGGLAAFYAFDVKACLLWAVAVLIITDFIVHGYLAVTGKMSKRQKCSTANIKNV